jgi:hypothetical protein
MATRIQLRRDTALNWQSNNPVLAVGELGLDLTNKNVKIGDGVTAWNLLDYVRETSADLINYDNTISGLEAENVQEAIDELKTLVLNQDEATELIYSNLTSGLTATTIQGAIDEIADGNVDLDAVDQDIIPSQDSQFDLGTPELKWKDLYLSGNSIYLGDIVLKDNGDGTFGVYDSDGTTPIQVSGVEADSVSYVNSISELTATTVQAAITELDNLIDTINGADTVEGSIAKAKKDSIDYTDLRELAITEEYEAAIDAAKLALGTNYSVADLTARAALTDLTVGDVIFVTDDGDAKWAQYKVTAVINGSGSTSTFVKIMDEDIYLNSISASAVLDTIKTVDGTGSGLDADLLDGEEGNYYTTSSNIDYDNTDSGMSSSNVKTAIDELRQNISFVQGELYAAGTIFRVSNQTEKQQLVNEEVLHGDDLVFVQDYNGSNNWGIYQVVNYIADPYSLDFTLIADQLSYSRTSSIANIKEAYENNADTNAFTDALLAKLEEIEDNAQVNVNANWDATEGDAQILNKPTTISGYGITDTYTKTEVDNTISSVNEDIDLKAPIESPTFTGTVSGITATMVGLGNVTNESKATIFTDPTFTGTVSGVTATMVGLGNVDNTSDIDKPISTLTQNALDLKAPIESPTFTGTVSGITKSMVGLTNVDNTSDIDKPISSATQDAIDLKAPINNPTFTGTVAGVTATMVGLGNVTNESKTTMFTDPTFTGTVSGVTKTMVGLANVDNTSDADKPISTLTQSALNLKAPLESPTFTGTVSGVTATMVGLGNVTNESKATMFTDSTLTGATTLTNVEFSNATSGGVVTWNNTDGTANILLKGENVNLSVGQELFEYAINTSGNAIVKGTVLMIGGADATTGRIIAIPSISTGAYPAADVMGIAAESITANGGLGYVSNFGYVRDIDISSITVDDYGDTELWEVGDYVYMDYQNPGKLTVVKPNGPNLKMNIAKVMSIDLEDDLVTLFVNIETNQDLTESNDVEITNLINNDLLIYDNASQHWKNVNLTTVYASPTLTGTVTLGSGARLTGVADPLNNSDAVNKLYVDSVAEGLQSRPSVRAATTTNLSANYYNGVANDGVGATLTADTNRAFTTLDGVTSWAITSPRMGVLVKNQTNAAHNGRYNLTTLGSASEPWVLTRCGLCDEADEIPGSYTFVQDGTVNEGTGWVQLVADPDTFVVGTDAIIVTQFSGAGTLTAGTGLTLTANEFSIDDDVVVTLTGEQILTNKTITGSFTGNLTGNADTVTNGIYSTASYSNPSWIVSLDKSKVGLGNVDNTSDADKPISSATQSALNLKAPIESPTFTGTVAGVTATMVGLGNVTNESKATMFSSPTFTGTVSGVTKTMVGLGSVENYAIASQVEAEAGTVTNKYMTPERTKQAILQLAPAPNLTNLAGTGLTYNSGTSKYDANIATASVAGIVSTTTQTFAGDKTFNGGILAADGTAGTPSIRFGSDVDSGIYRIGSDNFGFSTGGSLRMDLTSTQLYVRPTTASSSISTGAIRVDGGIGVGGRVFANAMTVAPTTGSTDNGGFIVEVRTVNPVSPPLGRIWVLNA